jgi:hypothetical protein
LSRVFLVSFFGGFSVKAIALFLSCALLAAPLAFAAELPSSSSTLIAIDPSSGGAAYAQAAPAGKTKTIIAPFSRVALSAGVSLNGVNLQVATNLNRYLNLRGIGNVVNYTDNNISTNGFNIDANLNMATAGAALDFYPFPRHGFRLSPGALFYNQNEVSASAVVTGGTKVTLNDQDYLSDSSDPLKMNGSLTLNTNKQAFTLTTGWGNMIPRKGGHWSFPFEIGAAFTGAPSLALSPLTGSACTTSNGSTCSSSYVNVKDPANSIAQDVQKNLTAQKAKWTSDLEDLKYYPIISFGLAYNFRIR